MKIIVRWSPIVLFVCVFLCHWHFSYISTSVSIVLKNAKKLFFFLNIKYTCIVLYDICVCISDRVCSAVLSPEEDSTQGSKGKDLKYYSLWYCLISDFPWVVSISGMCILGKISIIHHLLSVLIPAKSTWWLAPSLPTSGREPVVRRWYEHQDSRLWLQ